MQFTTSPCQTALCLFWHAKYGLYWVCLFEPDATHADQEVQSPDFAALLGLTSPDEIARIQPAAALLETDKLINVQGELPLKVLFACVWSK